MSSERKKILFVANVVKTHIMTFHIPYLKWFKDRGYEVHVAANNDLLEENEVNIPYCDFYHNVPFSRSPFDISNALAYVRVKKILGTHEFDLVHTHTPIASVITRLVAIKHRINGLKVVYTAHGFHFFSGGSTLSWILYYPIEKFLSRYTDLLITINKDDYNTASIHNFKPEKLVHVPGIGVDLKKFSPVLNIEEKNILRAKYGFQETSFILFFAGELSKNKNQITLINVVYELAIKIPEIILILAGTGSERESLEKEIKIKNLENNVKLIGYRNDIPDLLKCSDVAVSASEREGLPVNLLEAMATGLPLVTSDCRGNKDLTINHVNGYTLPTYDTNGYVNAILMLHNNPELINKFGANSQLLVKEYEINTVLHKMSFLYESLLTNI